MAYLVPRVVLTCPFTQVLECIWTWPLSFRNKIEDSHVIDAVKACAALEDNEAVKAPAQKVNNTHINDLIAKKLKFDAYSY